MQNGCCLFCILGKPHGKPKIRRELVLSKARVEAGGGGE